MGVVAAAATIGAVMGLGLRHGLALRPFATTGHAVLAIVGVAATATASAVAGIAIVTAAIVVLGVCFTVVAVALRGVRLLIAALAFGALAWTITSFVVPSVLTLSSGAVLGNAQRVFIFALLAVALVVGMRLARPASHID